MYVYRLTHLFGRVNGARFAAPARLTPVCRAVDRRHFSPSERISQDSTREHRKRVLSSTSITISTTTTTILGLAAAGVTGAALYVFYDAIHIPESVNTALEAIRNNPDVKELLGDHILFRSDWRLQQQREYEAHVEVSAAGNKSRGMFHCTLHKVDGKTWKVMKLDVIYKEAAASAQEQTQLSTRQLYDDLHKVMMK